MNNRKTIFLLFALLAPMGAWAQDYQLTSPDGHLRLDVSNQSTLQYSVSLDGKTLVAPSPMGFQLKGEKDMAGNFRVTNDAKPVDGVESWTPVVRNKADKDATHCQHATTRLKASQPLTVKLAQAGGYVAIIKKI